MLGWATGPWTWALAQRTVMPAMGAVGAAFGAAVDSALVGQGVGRVRCGLLLARRCLLIGCAGGAGPLGAEGGVGGSRGRHCRPVWRAPARTLGVSERHSPPVRHACWHETACCVPAAGPGARSPFCPSSARGGGVTTPLRWALAVAPPLTRPVLWLGLPALALATTCRLVCLAACLLDSVLLGFRGQSTSKG